MSVCLSVAAADRTLSGSGCKIFSITGPFSALIGKAKTRATSGVADKEKDRERKRGGYANPGLILDLTHHHHHGAGAAAGVPGGAAAGGQVAAAAGGGVGAAGGGGVSVNAGSSSSSNGGGGGLSGIPHHLGGVLGASAAGSVGGGGGMSGPSGAAGGGGDMVHDLILDGAAAASLCGGGGGVGVSGGTSVATLIGGSCVRSPSPARLAYTSEKHPRATFHELNLIRKHQELCDVVLNVGSRKILAHKSVHPVAKVKSL